MTFKISNRENMSCCISFQKELIEARIEFHFEHTDDFDSFIKLTGKADIYTDVEWHPCDCGAYE